MPARKLHADLWGRGGEGGNMISRRTGVQPTYSTAMPQNPVHITIINNILSSSNPSLHTPTLWKTRGWITRFKCEHFSQDKRVIQSSFVYANPEIPIDNFLFFLIPFL